MWVTILSSEYSDVFVKNRAVRGKLKTDDVYVTVIHYFIL